MKYLLMVVVCAGLLAGNVVIAAEQSGANDAELEKKLEDARKRLDEAAREIGELTSQLHGGAMDHVIRMVHKNGGKRRAMIGINIGERNENGKVTGVSPDGVVVLAVTPGGPAEKAGLKADDILTSLNGKSLKGGGKESNDKLTAVMEKVEPGEAVEIEYLRNGKKGKVKLETGEMSAPQAFGFMAPGDGKRVFRWDSREGGPMPPMPAMPAMPPSPMIAPMMAHRWGGMELVPLTPKLGQYFNTDKGLLVVRAPEAEGLELEEGDVILKIGDREPSDVRHAMRILRSYAPGETAEIEIMRKKRKRKIEYKASENAGWGGGPRHGYHFLAPDADGDFEVVIERDEGAGGDREVIIKKKRKVMKGDAPAGDEDVRIIVEEEDIGT